MPTLTVTAKGQVTLRRELLRHLGVQPGQQIEVSLLPGGRIQVRAVQPPGSIDSFIGCLAGQSAKVASLEVGRVSHEDHGRYQRAGAGRGG
jgi:antitoxin PrlF